jgi:hypothetical protein
VGVFGINLSTDGTDIEHVAIDDVEDGAQVILVDHNSPSESVDNIENAKILKERRKKWNYFIYLNYL